MKNAAVIVAAGRGERLGGDGGPKQYRKLHERAVLQHTVDCFSQHPQIDFVQVVIHLDDVDLFEQSVAPHDKLLAPITGGATRQESCKAGIDALGELKPDQVLIHDAARPFVSAATISNTLAGISTNICALPATAVADTVKRLGSSGDNVSTVDRKGLFLAQTPQGFMFEDIRRAHSAAASETEEEFTDDAAVAEWAGMKVKLVEGDRGNFKITTAEDLQAATEKVKMSAQFADVRTGSGYDIHILGPGNEIILCGIEIAHDQSLQGHSDADVGLHSLTDALLATIGAGDIGSHFPPSDNRWKGASSDIFLRHAVELVRAEHGTPTLLDVTIICEAPKIGPYRDMMRTRIAEICSVDVKRVSVKATTNEGIGSVGRGEGIAALATATVWFGGQQNV